MSPHFLCLLIRVQVTGVCQSTLDLSPAYRRANTGTGQGRAGIRALNLLAVRRQRQLLHYHGCSFNHIKYRHNLSIYTWKHRRLHPSRAAIECFDFILKQHCSRVFLFPVTPSRAQQLSDLRSSITAAPVLPDCNCLCVCGATLLLCSLHAMAENKCLVTEDNPVTLRCVPPLSR